MGEPLERILRCWTLSSCFKATCCDEQLPFHPLLPICIVLPNAQSGKIYQSWNETRSQNKSFLFVLYAAYCNYFVTVLESWLLHLNVSTVSCCSDFCNCYSIKSSQARSVRGAYPVSHRSVDSIVIDSIDFIHFIDFITIFFSKSKDAVFSLRSADRSLSGWKFVGDSLCCVVVRNHLRGCTGQFK